jgi:hypothetical protein
MKKKLTDRQMRVLKAIQGGEFCHYHPYMGRFNPHAYYSVGHIGKCTREVEKLIKEGLLKEEGVGIRCKVYLTEAGKSFVCELDDVDDVWRVNTYYGCKVDKVRGTLTDTYFMSEVGEKFMLHRNKDEHFFRTRNKAYNFLIKHHEDKIRSLKGRVKIEEEELEWVKAELKNGVDNI